jgi:two-component SAPR family response regulator
VNVAPLGTTDAPIISIRERLAAGARPRGLRVHAIGSLRLQHGRLTIQSLGGPKAGANQALGLFAFLFDRGPRGIDKDEAIEIIWPDAPLDVADTAFHRTMLGLRGTLQAGGMGGAAVAYLGGRYVLESGLISWSDVSELEQSIEASAMTPDQRTRAELLEACRQMNRADYMDDCPFFGTSVQVESSRALLRTVRHAVLVELAQLYASEGHLALSAMRRAEADALEGPDGRPS